MNKKTLYISDLDGTLLRSDETLSNYTYNVINRFVKDGMCFSYATARSYHTAHKVTKGLHAKIPLIVYNGTMIKNNITGEIIHACYFQDDIKNVIEELIQHHIFPIVYAMIEAKERFSYYSKSSKEILEFVKTREGDSRTRKINNLEELYKGDIFYISCIDTKDNLEPYYTQYKNKYNCIYSQDVYTQDQWLEILPKQASKANAIIKLKQMLNCQRVIVFGDGLNDINMFEVADEAYAVNNAVEPLKQKATDIIKSNDEDGVALWLQENFQK